MKKILKFLLVPIFVATPAITVVACESGGVRIDDRDVLSSAKGIMANKLFKFNMKADLGLSQTQMPDDKISYTAWAQQNSSARDKIIEFYSSLVREGNPNWSYQTVSVEIKPNVPDPANPEKPFIPSDFATKYTKEVESRVSLTAHLSYKGLSDDAPITIKIINDSAEISEQARINNISAYLKQQINTDDFVVSFGSLLVDGLKGENNNGIAEITAELKKAIFQSVTPNDPFFPMIDVDGVDLSVKTSDPAQSEIIYQLNDSAINLDKKVIEGVLQNLTLSLFYPKSGFSSEIKLSDLTTQHLKFAQSFSEASTQIETSILSQPPNTLSFFRPALPTTNQTLSAYDSDGTFRTEIKDKLFSFINLYYSTAKMKGDGVTDSWDATKIEITNPDTVFVPEASGYGHFSLDISFTFPVASENISATVSDLWIQLKAVN